MEKSADITELSLDARDGLICSYAALLLHDSDLDVTEDKLRKVIESTGNTVQKHYLGMFTKASKGLNFEEIYKIHGTYEKQMPVLSDSEVDWDTVTFDEKYRHEKPFPALPSNIVTAIILSFWGRKPYVIRMLQTLS